MAMALSATSFKDSDTKGEAGHRELMKWLMPWHAPTGAAGGLWGGVRGYQRGGQWASTGHASPPGPSPAAQYASQSH